VIQTKEVATDNFLEAIAKEFKKTNDTIKVEKEKEEKAHQENLKLVFGFKRKW